MKKEPTLEDLMEEMTELRNAIAEMNKFRFVDNYLDTEELCQLLKISSKTAKQWRDSGKLNYGDFGKKYLYQYSEIEEMLQKEFKRPKPVRKKNSPVRTNFGKKSSFDLTV